jgi:hypothetical protein
LIDGSTKRNSRLYGWAKVGCGLGQAKSFSRLSEAVLSGSQSFLDAAFTVRIWTLVEKGLESGCVGVSGRRRHPKRLSRPGSKSTFCDSKWIVGLSAQIIDNLVGRNEVIRQ